ncbi:GNAT family protein [Oceanispirochaeta sp.]|jgi:ribosomal-protein-serine acetyltransferase|uniref:GNAT family N-acetyltransferase n=1 Tax=Oceanispirochaeta sp. TaxID=2035350 RepID=UPI00260294CC|nr:GNAT family protein [Oceanispirochaeta sp.]MDA3955482.1 GNAT family protein [Oceanispirochaeta sp.]
MFYRYIDIEMQLCLLTKDNAPALYELTTRNRAYLRQWLPWVDGIQKPGDTDYFIGACLKRFATGEQMTCGILYQNQLVGVAGFNRYNYSTGTAYIGYWLSRDKSGRGIMTRAVKELEQIAFNEKGMNKIEIHCAVENTRSRRIPLRLGYKEEGQIRGAENLYGRRVNHVIYGLLKEEYLQR